jgi:PAS domain S-box-containing protein
VSHKDVNGNVTWVQTIITPIKDKHGNVTAALELAVPITERKKMEADSLSYEEKLLALHNHALLLDRARDPDEVVRYTLDAMEHSLKFTTIDVLVADDGYLHRKGSRGKPASLLKMPLTGPGVIVKAANTKKTMRIADTRKEEAYVGRDGRIGKEIVQRNMSELAVPVIIDGTVVAVLNAENEAINAFSHADQKLLELLALRFASDLRRLQEETELRKSREQYRTLLEASSDAISVNIGTRVAYANKRCADLLGFSDPSELVGRDFLEFVAPEDREIVKGRSLGRERGESVPALYEFMIQRKDGTRIAVETNATAIEYEGRRATLSFRRDITERKRLEEELKRYSQHLEELVSGRTAELKASEEKFRAITEGSFDPIITLNSEGHITYASPAFFLTTGFSSAQTIGNHYTSYLPKDEIVKLTPTVMKVLAGEVVRSQETEILRDDGSLCPVELSISPINETGGTVSAVEIIVRDVTERRKLAEMRNRFVSTVTHELRTPLVSILGYIDLTLSKPEELSKNVESNLQVVKRNSNRLLDLTNDLLDIQRMQAGRFQLNLKALNFKQIIDQCAAEIQPFIHDRRQSLSLNVPERPLPIQGDPIRLVQVLMNLFSNASKFTSEGGNITIHVIEQADVIKVQVSDTGIGIKPEDIEKIFQPFAPIQKRSYIKGTGLGLSITKGLVEAHGGKISAESEGEGKGTTFTLTIPKLKT